VFQLSDSDDIAASKYAGPGTVHWLLLVQKIGHTCERTQTRAGRSFLTSFTLDQLAADLF
jgi:hypothetical protein